MPTIKVLQNLNISGTVSANTITVNTLSALSSVNTPEITALQNASGNWNSTYSTVQGNSANWSVGKTLSSSGGNIGGNTKIRGDLIVNYLSALSGSSFVNTVFTTTSSLCVNSELNVGPAFFVGANGTGNIASFYDTDSNVEVLHIGGSNGSFPNVGIKVSDPTKTLTVSGEISASGDVWFNDIIANNNLTAKNGNFENILSGGNNLVNIFKSPVMDVYNTPGTFTWTKRSGATMILVELLAGGGGGGTGGKSVSGTAIYGGGGGGGGGFLEAYFPASDFSSTETVVVGNSGAGGIFGVSAAQNGGQTSFGTGTKIKVNAGSAGLSGTTSAGTGGSGGGYNVNTGGNSSITATAATGSGTSKGGSSGGGGGGIPLSGSGYAGNSGGQCLMSGTSGSGGTGGSHSSTGNGTAGGNGNINLSVSYPLVGSGGGGGGSSTFASGNGGNGGNGVGYGSGGGGGGATIGSGNPGNGGNGTAGYARITTFF